jgi:uncharacterized protein YceH (UPF0502 family)
MNLTPAEGRALGVLIEKEAICPDLYPLTPLRVWMGCNQKDFRKPRMIVHMDDVLEALEGLSTHGLAKTSKGRCYQRWSHTLSFDHRTTILIGALLLRGPSTPGELRYWTSRIHRFPTNESVIQLLQACPCAKLKGKRWIQTLTSEQPIQYEQELIDLKARLSWLEASLIR